MKISSLIIAIFIFVGMTTGLYSYYSDFITPYSNAGLTTAPSTASFYSQANINLLNSTVGDIALQLKNIGSKKLDFGTIVVGSLFILLDTIKLLLSLPTLIINVIADLLNISWLIEPIPNWFYLMVTTIITVYIIFRILSIIMGGRDI